MNLTKKVKNLIREEARLLLVTEPDNFRTMAEAEMSVYESLVDDLDDAGYGERFFEVDN
jgi:hypothetical protein